MNILIENIPTSRLFRFLRNSIYTISHFLELIFPYHVPRIIIFCYHSISSDGRRLSVKESEFKKQIDFLLKNYEPLRVSDIETYISGEKRLTRDAFILTFDDGYGNILTIKDFLKEQNIYPTAFVLSNNGNANYRELDMPEGELLMQAEIMQLKEAGWEIGSHSSTHADFRCLTTDKIESEVRDSKDQLEYNLDIPIMYFAYPKGVYNSEVVGVVKKSGYKLAFSMDDGYIASKDTNRFALPRVGVDGTHTMKQFPYLGTPFSMFTRKLIKKFI